MKKKILKIVDLLSFIYCVNVLIHAIKMFSTGWTITWFGIAELMISVLLLDILIEEYKKVLKVYVQKAFRVLRVNKIFTR